MGDNCSAHRAKETIASTRDINSRKSSRWVRHFLHGRPDSAMSLGTDFQSQNYAVYTDPYHNVPRLDLYEWNGAPVPPMYQIYNPPEMLPTTTLNPIVSSTANSGATSKPKAKRGLDSGEMLTPLNWKAKLEKSKQAQTAVQHINADRLWWVGLCMTGIGGLLYLGPRRMGIQL